MTELELKEQLPAHIRKVKELYPHIDVRSYDNVIMALFSEVGAAADIVCRKPMAAWNTYLEDELLDVIAVCWCLITRKRK